MQYLALALVELHVVGDCLALIFQHLSAKVSLPSKESAAPPKNVLFGKLEGKIKSIYLI